MSNIQKNSTDRTMNFKTVIFILSLLAFAISADAQTSWEDTYIPRNPTEGLSPNARSFHRYGEIPVSLYTGTPNISIPLATLREGQLTLPLELSYHSGGVKVNDHPGWTGLGWTLIAGGAITREVHSMPDEFSKYGYYANCKTHHLDEMNSSTDLSGFLNHPYDTEPDKFNFNFPGYSGFFILGSDGEWHVFCDRPIKISHSEPTTLGTRFKNGSKVPLKNEHTFAGFTLTADDGVEYLFGNGAVDLSISCYGQRTDSWVATAWYLYEIRHPNGDKIQFNYTRGDFVVNFTTSTYFIGSSDYGYGIPGSNLTGGDLISPVYLSSISTPTFNARFTSSTSDELNYTGEDYRNRRPQYTESSNGDLYWPLTNTLSDGISWNKLDDIVIMDYNNVVVRHISFNYSDNKQQRLTLEKLGIANREEIPSEWYSFYYNKIDQLPAYLSTNIDHWGYYGTISTIPDNINFHEPSTFYSGYGVLNKIQYPTGGYTILEYEPNKYNFIAIENESVEVPKAAGGVRIRRIINQPEDGSAPEVKTYTYNYGILEGKPIYRRNFTINNNSFYETSNFSLGCLTNNFGNHISYPNVREEFTDGSYNIYGFISPTEMGYRDEPAMQSNDFMPFVTHSLKGHYRGKTTHTNYYSSSGQLVKSIDYQYAPLNNQEKWTVGLHIGPGIIRSTNSKAPEIWFYKYSLYRNYYHQLVETSRTETTWDGAWNKAMTKTTFHTYNSLGQLKRDSTITVRFGKEQSDAISYEYVWENDRYFSNNHFMSFMSDIVSRSNGKTINHLSNKYFLKQNAPTLSSITNLFDGSDAQTLYTCGHYTSSGYPVQVVDKSGLSTIYLWGAHCLYPVAEIKNADISQVRKILGYDPVDSPDDPNIQDKIELLRLNLPEAMVTSYTFLPFVGITSMTDPAGKSTYFDYDFTNRLVQINDSDGNPVKQFFYNIFSGGAFGPK